MEKVSHLSFGCMWLKMQQPRILTPIDRLFPQLLRAIAMTELMLEHWCEPPDIGRWHLSTLIQQIMSVIIEVGGALASTLYERLITRGSFRNIDQPTFIRILRSMGDNDLVEQTPRAQ